MNRYSLKIRSLALLLTLFISLNLLTACGKKDDADTKPTDPPKAPASSQAEAKGDKSPSKEEKETETAKSENTTEAAKPKSTNAAPVTNPPKTPDKSGLNNKPSNVENASTSKDLAQVNPEQAADKSYDTDVSVSETQTETLNIKDFAYVPYSDFKSHILSVWQAFRAQDRVKIEAQYMNEYLNYVCLPLKDTFYEINCNGYEVTYGYDATGKYVYMDIKWSYYITAEQYAVCKSKAAEICAAASNAGSTADKIKFVHDRIAADNVYTLNVDGAYNCLVKHTSDCDGYTAAFKICMDILGIPCKAYATSDHIFNLVNLDGKWYVTDVTYDDQTPSGFIYTRYFLAGSSMYVNYPILKSMLSAADYPYSKKLTVTDDAKLREFLQIGNDVNYTLDDNGRIILDNGYYYTIK